MSKYKNISKEDLTLMGVGIIKSGEVVELPEDFHNANFIKIKKQPEQPEDKNK
jgi:hypothetical protein